MEKIMKTQEVIDAYKALNDYVKKDIQLSTQLAWDIEDNIEAFGKIVDRFERHRSELIQPLIEKKAIIPVNDNQVKVEEGYEEEVTTAFNKINEYLGVENTIEIKTITKKDIPETASVKDIRALKIMIAE